MSNDQDQMCRNCHAPRDTTDHKLGTHPVNVNYSAANAARPTLFLKKPITNAVNPTGQVKLINGKVLCSTCHGVHNTDSRTSTFDRYTAFGQLSSSKGYLLRVDAYGKTANDVNICTNCHAGKLNHNLVEKLGTKSVQCNDCHSGHVEYDAAAPSELKNKYLVRRYLQYTTAGRVNKRILYRYTGATGATKKEFYNASGNGVCQSCHKPPLNHYEVDGVTFPNIDHNTCAGCHSHAGTTGAFHDGGAGGCTNSCHGLPPVATSGLNGPATYNSITYSTFNEGATPHFSHAQGGGNNVNDFDCKECHQGAGTVMPAANGNFAEVFLNTSSTIAATGGLSPSYSGANCNNVYCHSDGKGSWKIGMNPISWGDVAKRGSIVGQPTECQTCHDDPNTSESHSRHITAKGYGCITCHSATVVTDNFTLKDSAKAKGGTHTNGIKDVMFSGTAAARGTYIGITCGTVACHSNGRGVTPVTTPTWGITSSGACGTCHATTPQIGGSLFINTNSHFTHLSTSYGPKVSKATAAGCQQCHNLYTTELGPTHVDDTIQTITTCTPCHPAGSTYIWTSAARLACTDCHSASPSVINSISAPYKQYFATSGHGQGDANHTASSSCTSCHSNSKKHIDGVLGSSEKRILGVNDNTHCSICHNDISKVPTALRRNMVTHVIARGGPAISDCKSCHDVHGTTNFAQVKTTINGAAITFPATGGDYINATNNGLCQTCHTLTNHFRRNSAESSSTFGTGWISAGTDHRGFSSTTDCLSCHKHNVGSFAFFPSGGSCDTCHGYPPVQLIANGVAGRQNLWSSARLQNYTGGGGVHNIAGHIPATAKASNGWNTDCSKCHYISTSHSMDTSKFTTPGLSEQARKVNVNVAVDPMYKLNSNFSLNQSRYDNSKATPNNTGKCSNVSCHFQLSPRWGTLR